MRRWPLIGVIAILGGSAIPTTLALGAAPPRTAGKADLQAFTCHRSLQPAKRVVSVTAVMRPVPGTSRLRMRFELISDAGGHLAPVGGGDLGTWISPHPRTLGRAPNDVWILRHPVDGLAVPADYRFRVTFRWLGAGRHAIATATRLSQTCWQPDLRPDLAVQSVKVNQVPSGAAGNEYVAEIANMGLSAARSFSVRFAPVSGAPQTTTVPKLPAGGTRKVSFVGPACSAANPPTITVDPDHLINDLNPSNNALTVTCPASAGASTPG